MFELSIIIASLLQGENISIYHLQLFLKLSISINVAEWLTRQFANLHYLGAILNGLGPPGQKNNVAITKKKKYQF